MTLTTSALCILLATDPVVSVDFKLLLYTTTVIVLVLVETEPILF